MSIWLHRATDQELFDQFYKSVQYDGKLMYIGRLLERASKNWPEKTALIFEGSSINYCQLYNRAVAFSKVLQEKGIKPRDRVVLLFENSIEFYVGYFGILQVGAVVIPLNIFLKEREIEHIIADAQPALIVADSVFMPLLQKIEGDALPPVLTEIAMLPDDATRDTQDLNFKVISLDPEELAILLYTSGTTGVPKGVMISSKNCMINVMQGASRFRYIGEERFFAVLPLFHSFAQNACVWCPLFFGFTIILVPKIDRRSILEGLQHKPTIFVGVPALYGLLCLLKTAPLESVKIFASGGDALSDKIRAAFALIYRRKIVSGYGLTEASPVVSASFDDETVPTNNIGKPLVGIECSLRDEQGNEVPRGEVGQLWVKGDNVMLGYYNAPDMTSAAVQDGWLDTGDLAYMDGRGRLVISGRIKDLIIHKGFNIYPQEIENVLMSHPNVMRAGVIGKDDDDQGQVPIAYVQMIAEEPNMERVLKSLCIKNLAAYKMPREFICSTVPLPTTATGKVDKKKLKAELTEKS